MKQRFKALKICLADQNNFLAPYNSQIIKFQISRFTILSQTPNLYILLDNHSRFVNKDLNKAIIQRSRLFNKYLKDKTRVARVAYKKQRNVCVSILRKSKKCCYESSDTKNITNSKKFWGTVKPLFSNKVRSSTNITLNEDEKLIKNKYQIANILNTFSLKLFQTLAIKLMKDIYVTLATFLTQLKKLYKNTKII